MSDDAYDAHDDHDYFYSREKLVELLRGKNILIADIQSALTTAQEENKRLVEAHKEVCRRYHTKQKNAKKWQLAADLAYMCDVSQSALNGGKNV